RSSRSRSAARTATSGASTSSRRTSPRAEPSPMPEGHTVHRLARTFAELFGGQPLAVTSPQGRFAAGAALLDGRTLADAEAWGKQMFLRFEGPDPEWLR